MPKNVLLIDPELKPRGPLVTELRGNGFEVTMVSSADAAIEQLKVYAFDLIILDPVMNFSTGFKQTRGFEQKTSWAGLDVLRLLRQGAFKPAGNHQNLPVIVFTTIGMDYQHKEIRQYQPSQLLLKPAPTNKIISACLEEFGLRNENQALRAIFAGLVKVWLECYPLPDNQIAFIQQLKRLAKSAEVPFKQMRQLVANLLQPHLRGLLWPDQE
jgi:CheY-like chemotaxis protein